MEGILKNMGNTPYQPGSLTMDDLNKAIGDFFKDEPAVDETACKFMYHRTVGFPKDIIIPNRIFHLGYTTHAKDRAKERVNGLMLLPSLVRLTPENLIEIHTDDNKYIKKAVVKLSYDKKRDIILVLEIKYQLKKAVVITLYYNYKKHSFDTLDKTKYTKP